jgi:glycosyltransferase involved in cell wall biosynthesis
MAAAAIGASAIVHTVHGAPFHAHQSAAARAFSRWCERFAARKCHAIVSVADAMTELLVQAGVAPREKFSTVYSGMDVAPLLAADQHREETRRALGYRPEHVVVGKIARLFHLKGHKYLIEAAEQVVRRRPEVRFLLVGDGVLRAPLEKQIRGSRLTEYFQFLGLVKPQRIPSLLGAMDVLVHVSLREGLARALAQALIAGKAVVSYDVDGAREVAIPGETGYLAPPESVGPLADALIELAGDAEQRRRLGRTGRARFTDQFRYERMTEQLRRLYERLLAARRS